jgi:hypothetical protein
VQGAVLLLQGHGLIPLNDCDAVKVPGQHLGSGKRTHAAADHQRCCVVQESRPMRSWRRKECLRNGVVVLFATTVAGCSERFRVLLAHPSRVISETGVILESCATKTETAANSILSHCEVFTCTSSLARRGPIMSCCAVLCALVWAHTY